MEERKVHIVEWPKDRAYVEHFYNPEKPCPVSIIFEDKPVQVQVTASEKEPLNVNMNMHVSARDPIPVCIKICEPICATSNYSIGINLFGQPLAEIGVRGVTRLAPCADEQPPMERRCQTHDDCKAGQVEPAPYIKDNISYAPVNGNTIQWVSLLPPPVPAQVLIPNDGLRVSFSSAVKEPELDLVNYSDPVIHIEVYHANTLIHSTTEVVENTRRRIILPVQQADMIIIRGGRNEAGLIEVCFIPLQRDPVFTHRVSIITPK